LTTNPFALRLLVQPTPDLGQPRGPVTGGIMGAAGRLAALEILKDGIK
jgi:hypothetical protein